MAGVEVGAEGPPPLSLADLPADVLLAVVSHLGAGDLGRLAQSCRGMRAFCAQSKDLWEGLGRRTWRHVAPGEYGCNWRRLCMGENHASYLGGREYAIPVESMLLKRGCGMLHAA